MASKRSLAFPPFRLDTADERFWRGPPDRTTRASAALPATPVNGDYPLPDVNEANNVVVSPPTAEHWGLGGHGKKR